MKPIYLTLSSGLRLMVIPDTMAHLDGHTVITQTYSVFVDTGKRSPLVARSKDSLLHLEESDDPDYFGYVTFEVPGKLFSYTAAEKRELLGSEAVELIEQLTHIRENPTLWPDPQQNG